jgi:hypothetical protein
MKMATCRFFKTCLNTLKNTHTFNKKNATKLKIESKPCQKKKKKKETIQFLKNLAISPKKRNIAKSIYISLLLFFFPTFW